MVVHLSLVSVKLLQYGIQYPVFHWAFFMWPYFYGHAFYLTITMMMTADIREKITPDNRQDHN